MKTLKLIEIKINNFKGIESFEVKLGQETNIFGFNGLGKSSIGDAIFWALWGKDQQDRKDHEIKNTVKTELNKQDHEVYLKFDLDGRHIPVKRIYSEKWTKKKGSETPEFTGHETTLFFDDVPLSLKDFNERINGIMSESIFKLVTNPLYFNSLNWKDRRKELINMAGEITDIEIAGNDLKMQCLVKELAFKSIDDYKAQITRQRLKIKEQLDMVPVQIKEAKRGIPETQDWETIETNIQSLRKQIEEIEAKILDKNKVLKEHFEAESKKTNEIHILKGKVQTIEFEAKQKADQHNQDLGKIERELSNEVAKGERIILDLKFQRSNIETDLTKYKSLREELLKQFDQINESELVFDPNSFVCPTCKREHDGSSIEESKSEMLKNFNLDKLAKIEAIQIRGKKGKELIEKTEKDLFEINGKISEAEKSLNSVKSDLDNEKLREKKELTAESFMSAEKHQIEAKIAEIEASKIEDPTVDNSELIEQKKAIETEIDGLKEIMSTRNEIIKGQNRVKELEEEETILAQEQTRLEGILFVIEKFINRKMTMVEESINHKFQFVKFKMFNILVNGSLEETCETMLDGVPWSTLNTGGRLKAGIDIINTFCRFYQVSAPMVLDNRESVFEIPYTENQVINLIASLPDKKLRVEIK
ncbi:MAG TPA: hypothetical protein VIH28_08340 [Ignavibacteriaceae bacterium]